MFVIDTFVVEDPAVRARVNSAHMMMLLRMLRPKQSARMSRIRIGWSSGVEVEVKRWMRCAAKVVVAVSVVLYCFALDICVCERRGEKGMELLTALRRGR